MFNTDLPKGTKAQLEALSNFKNENRSIRNLSIGWYSDGEMNVSFNWEFGKDNRCSFTITTGGNIS